MSVTEQLYTLSNCEIMRLDVDDEHYYYGGPIDGSKDYYLSVTQVLDIGAPFPEGLRQYLRVTNYEEQKERLEMSSARGSGLHAALATLMGGQQLDLTQYRTQYEKAAITTFIRMMRFLFPDPNKKHSNEFTVADTRLKVAGTSDWKGIVERWKLTCLLDPNKYLEMDSDGDIGLKDQWIDMPSPKNQHIIIDWKFTGRTAYTHKVQAAAYKTMNNLSYRGSRVSRAFTWRYSPRHKFGFDFQESLLNYSSFKRIYNTTIEYLGEFPAPPTIKRYPEAVRLYEEYRPLEQINEKEG